MKFVNNKIYLSWQDVEDYIAKIYNDICWTLKDYSSFQIVTIARGGLIPATLLAHKLNIKRINVIPPLHHTLDEYFSDLAIMPSIKTRLFFVDDIYDTGKTYNKISKYLFDYDFKPCFLVMKHQFPTDIPKTYFTGEILNDWRWIVFPWENDNTIETN